MAPVCQTCGDIGFEEALVFCDSCKIEAIHRYCIGITPTTFTEYITWRCEDCDDSESESDSIEVDQTAKLTHILKKSDNKMKKRSSNHTCPVLAEDHEIQDATTIVEPMEVSSSPIKETVESNSGIDHNAGTSKRSDSSSYPKEVDQTDDKLLNISKKNEKEKKKKRKKKKRKKKKDKTKNDTMSSDPNPLVIAVEDHGVQDATSVEPVTVSSSPIKGTAKKSKKRKISDSGNPHELTGLVRNGASTSEAEKSTSVPDHSSCTSKRNDCGSRRKEVDQTAKLTRILEKSEKKKKKKKKRSSDHSPVENNELHGATNVEPVVVSSSPIKETMEAKRQESSGSRKPHEATGLDGNGASVSEAEHSSSVRDHNNSYTTKKRKLSSGDIPLTDNRQLADGNSSCKEVELNTPQTSERLTSRHCRAQPIKIPIWRGMMSVKGVKRCSFDGIVAHVSSLACPRVHETASSLRGCLSAEMLPRAEIWPKSFLKNGEPKDDSVALFFFPSSESNDENIFYTLVGEMEKNDLAMRCVLDDAELLLFTSFMLPVDSWSFNSKDYLWGVFKNRRTSRQ